MMDEKGHRTPQSVQLMQVIEVIDIRGEGIKGDPVRIVHQYWSKKGVLLAEFDKHTDDLGDKGQW